jgi:hypothetical protein
MRFWHRWDGWLRRTWKIRRLETVFPPFAKNAKDGAPSDWLLDKIPDLETSATYRHCLLVWSRKVALATMMSWPSWLRIVWVAVIAVRMPLLPAISRL